MSLRPEPSLQASNTRITKSIQETFVPFVTFTMEGCRFGTRVEGRRYSAVS